MIHRFSVSNYHSIREEVVLDLRIPGTAPDLPRFRRSVAKPDVRLPTVAVLMGPNGSGKTTLLKALTTMARVATSAKAIYIKAVVPFVSERTLGEPTRFCLEIETDWLSPGEAPEMFRYELAVAREERDVNKPVVHRESLYHFPRGRPRRLLERKGPDESILVSREISDELGFGSKGGRLRAIRKDSSAMASLALLNVPLATHVSDWLQSLSAVTNLAFIQDWTPPTKHVVDLLKRNSGMMAWANKHLRSSDLGIRGVDIQDVTSAEEQDWKMVSFQHEDLGCSLPLVMESAGTRYLFHLMPHFYLALGKGVPAVVDEIDGYLHVDLVSEIVDWFHSNETNPDRAQLLVASHNVALLDDLEKEEVFIVEKTRDGATRVHGAQDVRGLRRDARLYPKYRAGVLGGIPKIG